MKFLFLHLDYPGSHLDGAARIYRSLIKGMGERSHTCEILTIAKLDELRRRQAGVQVGDAGRTAGFEVDGYKVRAFLFPAFLRQAHRASLPALLLYGNSFRQFVSERIREVEPDWLVVDCEHTLILQRYLRPVLERHYRRTLVIVNTGAVMTRLAHTLPRELISHAGLLLCGSSFLSSQYLGRLGDFEEERLPPSLVSQLPGRFGVGPYPLHAKFDHGFVTLVNPCREKGLAIFLDLARALPNVQFAAFLSWGRVDRRALSGLPNITVFDPVEDIEEIFRQTRILLAPSVCNDGFPGVVVEAMLRGVPVIASNDGGVPEAKLGVDFVIPVKPFYTRRNPRYLFARRYVFPHNDVTPWRRALSELLSDRRLYERISRESRAAALRFVENLSLERLETLLSNDIGLNAQWVGRTEKRRESEFNDHDDRHRP